MAPFYANETGQCSEGYRKWSEVIGGSWTSSQVVGIGQKSEVIGGGRKWSEA